ncbi:hypothetical protein F5Y18DRAFT_32943 [Xylariaceae sp. FL1019]|nr:hypothetical protein F5Y18DRAFT_32943 [Xylariaceae sp. FL1019]
MVEDYVTGNAETTNWDRWLVKLRGYSRVLSGDGLEMHTSHEVRGIEIIQMKNNHRKRILNIGCAVQGIVSMCFVSSNLMKIVWDKQDRIRCLSIFRSYHDKRKQEQKILYPVNLSLLCNIILHRHCMHSSNANADEQPCIAQIQSNAQFSLVRGFRRTGVCSERGAKIENPTPVQAVFDMQVARAGKSRVTHIRQFLLTLTFAVPLLKVNHSVYLILHSQ